MAQAATLLVRPDPGRYHWTVEAFYRAISAGVFDEPGRLELVNGDLWEKESVNPPHASTGRRVSRLLRELLEPGLLVMEEKPFHIADDGEPRPDVCVVIGSEEDYEERHPSPEEIRLIVEIADTTADRDTGEKALLYARAGIADYWVVLLNARELWVYRNPSVSGYPDPVRLSETSTISPLIAPGATISVSDILPRRPSSEQGI